MANSKKKRSASKKKQEKKVQFSLSWGGLVSFGFFGALALIWVFILGVIVGRGYQPETLLNSVKRFIPGISAPEEAPRETGRQEETLQAEDLNFIEDLKKKVQNQLQDSGLSSPQEPEKTKKSAAGTSSGDRQQTPEYHCVYQVAAFKRAKPANQVASDLQTAGLQTSVHEIEKSGQSWFRVYVRFTGSTRAVQDFEQKLNQLGLGSAFLRSKALQ
ncbi:MAG: SPOR domain-containing protein [Desulfohalobiaceae bacterium]|nr:SPOR domain-containing protein [Desulfohalobiaceae bacterium]